MSFPDQVGGALARIIERYVNWRRARAFARRQKMSRHHIVEWVKSFLWAAAMVLLINQYALQAYQIPSGSMRTTLVEGDRIFVGKFIFGPELLPGVGKVQGVAEPRYGDVVIFENPTYVSRGTLYTILQRVLYMVTLSLVDLERGAAGEHQIQLLIKRHIGNDHEQVRIDKGIFYFKALGAEEWRPEEEYQRRHHQEYALARLVDENIYDQITLAARAVQKGELDLPLTTAEIEAIEAVRAEPIIDRYHFEQARNYAQLTTHPHELFRLYRAQRHRNGWYLPAGYFLPLGDNRDNSRDGRYYGIIAARDVLGKARLRYWPLRRAGLVR